MKIKDLIRKNIQQLTPYSSARDEYTGENAIFLDANENPFNSPFNRYPDPLQRKLKQMIADRKGVKDKNIFIGNGSDEAIDLLIRAFCEPRIDNIVSIAPSYGMYKVAADINDVEFRTTLLTKEFQLDLEAIFNKVDKHTKLIYLCSPNNPTGNCFDQKDMKELLAKFQGLVVVDEAYIDFAPEKSLLKEIESFNNLVILQTFSKSWGMAGVRLGMAYACEEVIDVLNKIKYPYNVNILTQKAIMEVMESQEYKDQWINTILEQKERVKNALGQLNMVKKIYPSDANFLLVQFGDPRRIYESLVDKKIIVRDRSKVALCEGCLRITIGTEEENTSLLNALKLLQ